MEGCPEDNLDVRQSVLDACSLSKAKDSLEHYFRCTVAYRSNLICHKVAAEDEADPVRASEAEEQLGLIIKERQASRAQICPFTDQNASPGQS